MSKQYYIIVDTETTIEGTVADFGAVLMDKQGNIVDELGVLVDGQFNELELWFDPLAKPEDFWSRQHARARRKQYERMLASGIRSIASPALINLWLTRVIHKFKPKALTAYNISFDLRACRNTGIDLGNVDQFCLLLATRRHLKAQNPEIYPKWAKRNGYITKPSQRYPEGRESYSADATSHWFYRSLPVEPHTALEDARDFEGRILKSLLKRYGWWGIHNLVADRMTAEEKTPN